MNLTNEDVQEILQLLDASPYDELHLETARFKLTLRRSSGEHGGWTQERRTGAAPGRANAGGAAGASASVNAPAEPNRPPAAGVRPTAASPPSAAAAAPGVIEIRAPLIGTFYRAPKPGAPPFVEVGSVVDEHTVVGIVETMKLMNSVHAGASGEVTEICAADGQFVEQNHVLIRLRPTRI